MTRDDAAAYAARWIDAWNRRDLDAVLATFADTVAFTSPRALQVVGRSTVHGKAALRAYWTAALARAASLRFDLTRIAWDPTTRELAIVYRAQVNDETKHVSENLQFGDDDRVTRVDVFHGLPPS